MGKSGKIIPYWDIFTYCLSTQDINSQTSSFDSLKAYVNYFACLKAFFVLVHCTDWYGLAN